MVALLRLLEHGKVVVEHLLFRESNAVETHELLAFLVTAPIGSGHAGDFDRFDVRRIRNVRATAEVGERALRIGGNLTVFQFAD